MMRSKLDETSIGWDANRADRVKYSWARQFVDAEIHTQMFLFMPEWVPKQLCFPFPKS